LKEASSIYKILAMGEMRCPSGRKF